MKTGSDARALLNRPRLVSLRHNWSCQINHAMPSTRLLRRLLLAGRVCLRTPFTFDSVQRESMGYLHNQKTNYDATRAAQTWIPHKRCGRDQVTRIARLYRPEVQANVCTESEIYDADGLIDQSLHGGLRLDSAACHYQAGEALKIQSCRGSSINLSLASLAIFFADSVLYPCRVIIHRSSAAPARLPEPL